MLASLLPVSFPKNRFSPQRAPVLISQTPVNVERKRRKRLKDKLRKKAKRQLRDQRVGQEVDEDYGRKTSISVSSRGHLGFTETVDDRDFEFGHNLYCTLGIIPESPLNSTEQIVRSVVEALVDRSSRVHAESTMAGKTLANVNEAKALTGIGGWWTGKNAAGQWKFTTSMQDVAFGSFFLK